MRLGRLRIPKVAMPAATARKTRRCPSRDMRRDRVLRAGRRGAHNMYVHIDADAGVVGSSWTGFRLPSNRETTLTEGLRVVLECGFSGASVREHSWSGDP